MENYNFLADLLNKFSQLTPWVQGLLGLGMCSVVLGVAYFFKETVVVLVSPFRKEKAATGEKLQWRDKYYRGEESSTQESAVK